MSLGWWWCPQGWWLVSLGMVVRSQGWRLWLKIVMVSPGMVVVPQGMVAVPPRMVAVSQGWWLVSLRMVAGYQGWWLVSQGWQLWPKMVVGVPRDGGSVPSDGGGVPGLAVVAKDNGGVLG